ncbi:MAG: SpoIIE family protein phosphatase, partial [Desulforhopalus sp.]
MSKKEEKILADLGFTAEESHTILKISKIRSFPKDSIVLENCYLSEYLYIILEGEVNVFSISLVGKTSLLAHYYRGDYFGGIKLGDVPHRTSIKTLVPSRFLMLRVSDLKALLPDVNKFTKQIFENLLIDVEKKTHELSEIIQQKRAISAILSSISNSPTNLSSLLQTVAENAARLCEANDASIMQVEGDVLRLVAKFGETQLWPVGVTRRMNRDWVTGRAVIDRTPIHVIDLQAEESEFPEGAEIAKKCGHRTVFVVPLMRNGQPIGTILIRRFIVNPVTEKQMELLKTFADQAAIAIDNVNLFTEIKRKSRKLKEQSKELTQWNAMLESRVADQVAQLEQFAKLEHELTLARDIQISMLPRLIPFFKGYEFYAHMIPATSVGGDLYDFIPLGDDSIAIAIGDVADKGVPAALFMAMVRSFLRAEIRPGISPKEVLQRVNLHIMDMNDKGVFVTVLLGILNNTSRQFTYTRAGHELPILVDDKGKVKRLSKGKGQALGVF